MRSRSLFSITGIQQLLFRFRAMEVEVCDEDSPSEIEVPDGEAHAPWNTNCIVISNMAAISRERRCRERDSAKP